MLLSIQSLSRLVAFIPASLLAGCSALLPLDYKDYSGADAATLVVQEYKGHVGTLYVAFYEKKGDCYDRVERYELDSSVLGADGSVITRKVPPNRLVAFQQLTGGGPNAVVAGQYLYNPSGYVITQWVSLIPKPGKRYFLAPRYGAREIPESYTITPKTNPANVFTEFQTVPEPSWDVNKRCTHLVGGS